MGIAIGIVIGILVAAIGAVIGFWLFDKRHKAELDSW